MSDGEFLFYRFTNLGLFMLEIGLFMVVGMDVKNTYTAPKLYEVRKWFIYLLSSRMNIW
jgi:hypothetical protein